jgi:hypothetical protein
MAQSSDELIKREIVDFFRGESKGPLLRIFPQSSRDDQKNFSEGGLTFGVNGTLFGSCDAAWYEVENWLDRNDGLTYPVKPILALEATDALSRGSSGNAQYQRFHHALGAVRNKVTGVYYFRKGPDKIQPDLFGMAAAASRIEKTPYVVTDDLGLVKSLLKMRNSENYSDYLDEVLIQMETVFASSFKFRYGSDWNEFAKKRSTIIMKDKVIKYAARNVPNFTESSQRAGHIAVGEMYLTKYFFPGMDFFYLFPRMSQEDLRLLDRGKATDKEWFLLRNEPGVTIKTIDDIENLSENVRKSFLTIKNSPLKGPALQTYKAAVRTMYQEIFAGKARVI